MVAAAEANPESLLWGLLSPTSPAGARKISAPQYATRETLEPYPIPYWKHPTPVRRQRLVRRSAGWLFVTEAVMMQGVLAAEFACEARSRDCQSEFAGRAPLDAGVAAMVSIGTRSHELRIDDAGATWRIFYRIDPDAVVILEVLKKKTQATKSVIDVCRHRLADYDRTD